MKKLLVKQILSLDTDKYTVVFRQKKTRETGVANMVGEDSVALFFNFDDTGKKDCIFTLKEFIKNFSIEEIIKD